MWSFFWGALLETNMVLFTADGRVRRGPLFVLVRRCSRALLNFVLLRRPATPRTEKNDGQLSRSGTNHHLYDHRVRCCVLGRRRKRIPFMGAVASVRPRADLISVRLSAAS
jgi:hypothetical protein